MAAFYLGLILGTLGGFLCLGLLSLVVRKEVEVADREQDYGELLSNQIGRLSGVADNLHVLPDSGR